MATNNAINLNAAGIVSYNAAGTFTALANPLTVANGGIGVASNTAYAVLCGGTTSTNPVQSIASVGNSGEFLTSGGGSLLPRFLPNPKNRGYCLYLYTATGSPLDGQTRFMAMGGGFASFGTSGSVASNWLHIPKTGTITAMQGQITNSGTTGSSQTVTVYIRLNNTTDTTVTSSLTFNASATNFSNTALSIAVTAGDYVEIKMLFPTWTTNPTSVAGTFVIVVT